VIRFPGNGADVWILKSHISRVECERSAFGRTEPLVIDQQGANGLRTALPVLLHPTRGELPDLHYAEDKPDASNR